MRNGDDLRDGKKKKIEKGEKRGERERGVRVDM